MRSRPPTDTSLAQADTRWTRAQMALLLLLVLVAVAYATRLRGGFTYPDEREYTQIAENLAHHSRFSLDGVRPTASRPPSFPWLLAGFIHVRDSVRFLKTVNLGWWLLAGYLVAKILRVRYGALAATVGLVFYLGYVANLYTAGTLYAQSFAGALFLLSIALHFCWRRSGTLGESLAQGGVFSVLVLAVPLYAVNFLVYLALVAFKERRRVQALVTLAVVALAVAAWTARNTYTFGTVIPVADNSGINLLFGNSPAATPNSGVNMYLKDVAPEADGLPEAQQDAILKKHAVAWIRSHPRQAAVLYAEKLLNWFNYSNKMSTGSEKTSLRDLVMAATYYPLLALAVFYLVAQRRRLTVLDAYLVLSYLAAAVTYAVFFTRIRFRLPFDDCLIILAAAGLSQLTLGRARSAPAETTPEADLTLSQA